MNNFPVDLPLANVKSTGIENRTASADPWLKALEKAHYEEQREAMTSALQAEEGDRTDDNGNQRPHEHSPAKGEIAATDRSATSMSGTQSAVSDSTGISNREGGRTVGVVAGSKPQIHNSVLAGNATGPTLMAARVESDKPGTFIKCQGSWLQSSFQPLAPIARTSMSLIPGVNGLELIVRNSEVQQQELLKTLAGLQSFLGGDNQRLSSVRVNGNIWWQSTQVFPETESVDVEPGKINRTF